MIYEGFACFVEIIISQNITGGKRRVSLSGGTAAPTYFIQEKFIVFRIRK